MLMSMSSFFLATDLVVYTMVDTTGSVCNGNIIFPNSKMLMSSYMILQVVCVMASWQHHFSKFKDADVVVYDTTSSVCNGSQLLQ